jgi:hypothetical protein
MIAGSGRSAHTPRRVDGEGPPVVETTGGPSAQRAMLRRYLALGFGFTVSLIALVFTVAGPFL